MRKIIALLLMLIMLTGCAPYEGGQHYSVTYWDLFDTVTTVTGSADNQEAFRQQADAVHEALLRYHRLFDIYNEYEDMNNLKTVNDAAGKQPVAVDPEIIDLLLACKEYYAFTKGRVNVAMGSVLRLWHDARQSEIPYLPAQAALSEASRHTDIEKLVIDEKNATVFLADEQMRLDVGAVAKGWAVQRVAEAAPKGMLLSVGGNICATGAKDEANTPWVVGIQNPDESSQYLHTLEITGGSVVTSGDYQRCFVVDGKSYHHIIDPDTQIPGRLWRAVTVVCADSGLADALSTALFLLPLEQGKALAQKAGAEAFWLDGQGNRFYTDGFSFKT